MSLSPYFENRKHIAVGIDSSGGLTVEIYDKYIRELNAALKVNPNVRLSVWFFDTCVRNEVQFVAPTVQQIESLQPVGYGGTLCECNWKHIKDMQLKPDLFVLFSDGYFSVDSSQSNNICETIFVIHAGHWKTAPFGHLVEISV